MEPKIPVEVRTVAGCRGAHSLVDTGADISVASRSLAERIGHDWGGLRVMMVRGVGAGQVPARLGMLTVRLREVELSVRCLFLDQRDASYVLGCTDLLDRFALTIDAGQEKLAFTKII